MRGKRYLSMSLKSVEIKSSLGKVEVLKLLISQNELSGPEGTLRYQCSRH